MATLELAIQATKVRAGATDFINATVQIKGAARNTASEVGLLNNTIGNTGKIAASVTRVVGQLFAGFGAIQGVREAVRTFAEFEQTMASIHGVLGATEDQMNSMRKAALAMGASSRSSANQSAEALLTLGKAGFTATQSIEALPGVLALATAHQLDLGAASDYTANILNQFGLATTQTTRVVDVLSTTANKSLADVRDLAETMKYAGPTAGALGLQLEEVAAAAGVLADRGIKASLAGTNLRGIMVDLVNPTAKARATLDLLGLTVNDIDVRTVGLTGAFEALARSGAGVQDLAKIFGVMQVSGASALVQHIRRIKELTAANKDSAGSTQELVNIMQDTLMGRFKEFVNILGVAIIKIGDSGLGKSVKDLLVNLTDAIRLMAGFEDKIVGSRSAAESTARVLKALAVVLTSIVAVNVVGWLLGVVKGLTLAMFTTAGWSSQLTIVSGVLAGLLAYDIGGYLYNEFKPVREFGNDLAAAFQTAASQGEYYWDVLIIKLKSMWGEFVNWVSAKVGQLSGPVATIMNAIAPGTGASLAAIGSTPIIPPYPADSEIAAAAKRRDARQADISTGYNEQVAAANKAFGNSNRLTGDGYLKHAGESVAGLVDQLTAWMKAADGINIALDENKNRVDDASSSTDAYKERIRDTAILSEEAHKRVLEMIAAVQDEAAALNQSQRERNVLIKVTQFQAVAEEAYGKQTELTRNAIVAYTKAVNDLEDAKADKKFGEKIRQLREETSGLALNTRERRVAVEVAKFQADAEEAYGVKSAKAAEMTARYREALDKLTKTEELRNLADNIGDEFGKAFTDIIFGAKSARDAIEGLTKAIIQMVFQQMVAKQISGWISGGIMSAFGGGHEKGNAFSGGSVIPFARGGVVAGPTTFPMSNNRTGLMGENGPEAIMPLSRGVNGKLGVEVTGHATKVMNVSVRVEANNPNEFRGSERQIAMKMRTALQSL